jgi:hypothetical protein
VATTLQDLIPSLPWFDEAGRYYSPFIERGADGTPESVPIPSLEDMRGLAPDELAAVAGRFGWIDTWDARMDAASTQLAAFGYDPGRDPAAYDRAMQRMVTNSERALLGVSRRLSQRYETTAALDGDMTKTMIYVNESATPCDECERLGGTVKTYAEFVADGDLPGDRCLGGNNCMCALVEL